MRSWVTDSPDTGLARPGLTKDPHLSGDSQWTDTLIEASASADLFVCESYVFEGNVPLHNSYRTIMENRPRLSCKEIILTHMSEDGLWLHLS